MTIYPNFLPHPIFSSPIAGKMPKADGDLLYSGKIPKADGDIKHREGWMGIFSSPPYIFFPDSGEDAEGRWGYETSGRMDRMVNIIRITDAGVIVHTKW